MDIKVMKFGGTSLKSVTTRKYVYNHILKDCDTHKLIIVVSAIGRFPSPYATDTLLSYAHEKMSGEEKARLASIGEMFASLNVCSELLELGLNVKSLSFNESGIISDDSYAYGNILNLDSTYIQKYFETYDILVVCGFTGINKENKVTTLGRGGSDFSAVLYAHMLGLKEVDIYTDVDGVYNSDPNLNKNAKKIDVLNYDEMLNLKSKVLADRCVEYAKKYNIKINLKGTFSKSKGSVIKQK